MRACNPYPKITTLRLISNVIQRRQLDWTGGGKIFNYDHLAMSSNNNKNNNNNKRQVVEDHSTDGPPDSPSSGLPGEPGVDYPILPSIPLTNFHCRGRVPGFYGDTQTACQVKSPLFNF